VQRPLHSKGLKFMLNTSRTIQCVDYVHLLV